MKKLKVTVGYDQDFTWQTPNGDGSLGSVFVSTDAITSQLWAGDQETVLATPTVIWGSSTVSAALGAPQTLWTVQFKGSDTTGLTPGIYRLQVFATHSTRTGKLFDGLVVLGDTAGSNAPTDLITLVYAQSAISRLRLSREERDFLPSLVTVASDTIRKWCGQRDFTRQIYTEEHISALNGYVALKQFPVNAVSRIRGYPQTVLTIAASPASNQQAWVSYTTTGDWTTGTLVYTGLVLNSVANGTLTTTPLLFSTYPTVGALAAAVAAVSSWSTTTTPVFSLYPSTDLSPPGGLTSQGAMDDTGCELVAYTEDLTCCRLDNQTGFLWTGRNRIASAFGERWGQDWLLLEDFDGAPIGRVQVTYDAGFTQVPTPVQLACAELVKAMIERFRTDHMLTGESIGGAGTRAYQVAAELVGALPKAVRLGLALYQAKRVK